MGDRGPKLPRPDTPPSGVKRVRPPANLAESPSAHTPPGARRQRPRTSSTSPEVASRSSTSTFPDSRAGLESFLVYLPNATSVNVRVDRAILNNMTVREFVEAVHTYERRNPPSGARHRQVQWTNDVYVEDFEGNTVEDGGFCTLRDLNKAGHGLLLYDNHPDTKHSHSGFWNVTPVPHVLDTLPQDYTVFSALADELDNSLQAVYQLKPGKRRLICVILDKENMKIKIFDTGKGMDSTAENSIAKWGTLGASTNRHERSEAIGGDPPYLKPNFGMYGFGGIGAGFHLGGSISVSSKTEKSRRVSVLHLTKKILKTTTADGRVWRTAGEFRSPTPKELELSPHGSFTKVEISDLKGDIRNWKVDHVQRMLKDYYFPYIQNDDGTDGTTSTPVQIRVNNVDLAEVLGGEVAHTNCRSGNKEPFILILKLKKTTVTPDDLALEEANARITCRYFPMKEGGEAIRKILDALSEENPDYMEVDFEKFARRSIRRLGRLLPDSQIEKVLPFMELKKKKGDAQAVNKYCYKRVKAFIDVDAGFTPTPSKMDLASGDPFSTALLNLGKGGQSRGNGKLTYSKPGSVIVSIQRQRLNNMGCYSIEEKNLQKDYEDWIKIQHEEDTGPEILGDNNELIFSTEQNKKELNISDEVFQVVYSIRYPHTDWIVGEGKPPMRLKLQKGIPNLNNNDMVLYVTVECFISEGLSKFPGEARIICRPIGVPEKRGCRLFKVENLFVFELRESRAFPIEDLIFSDKCEKVDEDVWQKQEQKLQERLPGFIEVLNDQETKKLVGHESISKFYTRAAGAALPAEILAVVRPVLCKPGNLTVEAATHLEPKFIIGEAMEMKLVVRELKYHPQAVKFPRRTMEEAPKIYETTISPSQDRKLPKGVYSFSTNTTVLEEVTKKSRTYFFIFSLVNAKHQDVDDFFVRMNITPSPKIGSWSICSHPGDCEENHKNQSPEAVRLRLGQVNPQNLYLSRVDEFGNPMEFEDIPSDIACSICTGEGNEVAVSPVISRDLIKIMNSKLNLEIPISVLEGNLAPLRPTMQAVLKMTIANALIASFTISVLPGEASSARIVNASEAPLGNSLFPEGNSLYPGQTIDEMIVEVLDKCQNPVSSGKKVKVLLDGFAFQDKIGPERSVDDNGRLDLGMRLRVKAGFGESVRAELQSTGNLSLLVIEFTTFKRALRVRNVPDFIPVGSQLTGLEIEAITENGEVDLTMSENDHVLTLDWDRSIIVPLFEGRGTLQGITMPLQEGNWEGCVSHRQYSNLQTKIKVKVVKKVKSERVEDDNLAFLAPSAASPSHNLPTSPVADIPGLPSPTVDMNALKNLCQTTKEETEKLERKLMRLDKKLIKHKAELERYQERQKQHEEAKRQHHALLRPVSGENQAVEVYLKSVGANGLLGCTVDQVEKQIAKLSVPTGTNAATLVLQAKKEKHSEVLDDIIGIVALLGAVDTEELNRALVEFLGLENMLSIVCRSRSAAEYIGMPSIDRAMGNNKNLSDFVKSRNLELSGRWRVLSLNDESSFFKRGDGRPVVDTIHPQKLLNMGQDIVRPEGSLGYAVNMILLNEEQLQIRVSGNHGLRESLFFLMFGFLEVFDTTDNMLRARLDIRTSAVSLEGGLIRTRNQFESTQGLRNDPPVWFPTWIPYMAPAPLQSQTPSKSVKGSDNTKKLMEVEEAWQANHNIYLSECVEENIRTLKEKISGTKEKISAAEDQINKTTERFQSQPGREHIHELSLAGAAENANRPRVSAQNRKTKFDTPRKC